MKKLVLIVLLVFAYSCRESNPNKSAEAIVESQTLNSVEIEDSNLFRQKVYIPIYSEIYQRSGKESTMLTATLSIRNTSEKDSIFLSRVDYYDTKGDLVRKYLEKDIYLYPLETIDYIIEESDTSGGTGANFILEWYGKEHLTPVFQAVMVGGIANRVFSFTTEGKPINE